MTPSDPGPEAESWAFALQIYAEPGVAEACLRLQAQVDVILLLVATFAAVRWGLAVDVADVEELDALCRPWREQVVKPLRALRMTLKSGPAPAPGAASEPLRAAIKASELEAERLETLLLADRLRDKQPGSGAPARCSRGDLIAALHRIVAHAAGTRAADAGLVTAVDTIADAAIRIAR